MDSKCVNSVSDVSDSGLFSGNISSTPCATTSGSPTERIVADGSSSDNNNSELDSGIHGNTARDQTALEWTILFAIVKSMWKNTTISKILDQCFEKEFLENPNSSQILCFWNGNRSELKEAGTLMHEYIKTFFDTFDEPNQCNKFVREMLSELGDHQFEPIAYDKISQTDRKFGNIHMDLYPELVQFYNFVNDGKNKMIVYKTEYSFNDPNYKVYGRCNGLFRLEEFGYDDRNLMLMDWTRSPLMLPGTLSLQRKTLQLNLYKYILETFEGKNIVKMCSVIFHKDIDDYEIIDIEDIHFAAHFHNNKS